MQSGISDWDSTQADDDELSGSGHLLSTVKSRDVSAVLGQPSGKAAAGPSLDVAKPVADKPPADGTAAQKSLQKVAEVADKSEVSHYRVLAFLISESSSSLVFI